MKKVVSTNLLTYPVSLSATEKTHFFSSWFFSTDNSDLPFFEIGCNARFGFPLSFQQQLCYIFYFIIWLFIRLKSCFRPLVKEELQQPFRVSLITANVDNFATEVSGNHFTQSQPRFNHSRLEKCCIGYFKQNWFWLKWLVPIKHDLKQTF